MTRRTTRCRKPTRAELHEGFADWLEQHGDELVERDEILGYHLEQAYRYRAELGPVDDRGRRLAERAARCLADGLARRSPPRRSCGCRDPVHAGDRPLAGRYAGLHRVRPRAEPCALRGRSLGGARSACRRVRSSSGRACRRAAHGARPPRGVDRVDARSVRRGVRYSCIRPADRRARSGSVTRSVSRWGLRTGAASTSTAATASVRSGTTSAQSRSWSASVFCEISGSGSSGPLAAHYWGSTPLPEVWPVVEELMEEDARSGVVVAKRAFARGCGTRDDGRVRGSAGDACRGPPRRPRARRRGRWVDRDGGRAGRAARRRAGRRHRAASARAGTGTQRSARPGFGRRSGRCSRARSSRWAAPKRPSRCSTRRNRSSRPTTSIPRRGSGGSGR